VLTALLVLAENSSLALVAVLMTKQQPDYYGWRKV
jgi:hypothetical protein